MSEKRTKKINDFFIYKNNNLYVEDVSVINIANNIKTPFYVYSTAALRRRYIDLATSLNNIKHSLYFSVKSNSNLAVLRVLSLLGSGMDVVSGGEYLRAQKAGVPGNKVVFSGVGKTYDEIKQLDYDVNLPLEKEIDIISKRIGNYKDTIICDDLWVYDDVTSGGLVDFDTHCSNHNHNITLNEINPDSNLNFVHERFSKSHDFKKVYKDSIFLPSIIDYTNKIDDCEHSYESMKLYISKKKHYLHHKVQRF